MTKFFLKTPLLESKELSGILKGQVYLKVEAVQPSGSFKNRGIGYLCSHYAKTNNVKSFISSSGGNAGLAVAYAGRLLQIPVKVVVPKSSLQHMVEKIEKEEAKVIVHGEDWNAADDFAKELSKQPNAFYIPPFDHPLIWRGHASIIHEIHQDGLQPDAIVVAVGGGGLFCGIIQGLQEVGWQGIPVFTAETEGAASLAWSIETGKLISLDSIKTIATSLGAKRVAKQAFDYAQSHPVFPKVVSDRHALNAVMQFTDHHRLLVEPACGAALALIYERIIDPSQYKRVLVVVCGGSGVTQKLLQEWDAKVKL